MFDFFFDNAFITGVIVAVIAAIELVFLVFRFETYKSFFRRRRWMHLLFQESESRAVLISSAVLFLVIGLAMILVEKSLLPRATCAAACVVAFLCFLSAMVQDKRRKPNSDESLS